MLDIRLNNLSQLTGFTKKKDLEYFLDELGAIKYLHCTVLALAAELFKDYKEVPPQLGRKKMQESFKLDTVSHL